MKRKQGRKKSDTPANLLLSLHLLAEEHRRKAAVLSEAERVLGELMDQVRESG